MRRNLYYLEVLVEAYEKTTRYVQLVPCTQCTRVQLVVDDRVWNSML